MRKVIFGVLITIVLVGGILVIDHSMRVNSRDAKTSADQGKKLPGELKVVELSSKAEIPLARFGGKVVLINFWASWCEACMAEMPSIQKLYEMLGNEGLEVIAINVDDNPEKVVPLIVNKLHLTFRIFKEKDSELTKAFDVVAIPFSVVADRQQKIVWGESGERDWASPTVVEEIRKLLKPI